MSHETRNRRHMPMPFTPYFKVKINERLTSSARLWENGSNSLTAPSRRTVGLVSGGQARPFGHGGVWGRQRERSSLNGRIEQAVTVHGRKARCGHAAWPQPRKQ